MNRFRWISAMVVIAMLLVVLLLLEKKQKYTKSEESEAEVETTIIPSMQLDETYYKTLIPYKESASRGLVVSNITHKIRYEGSRKRLNAYFSK